MRTDRHYVISGDGSPVCRGCQPRPRSAPRSWLWGALRDRCQGQAEGFVAHLLHRSKRAGMRDVEHVAYEGVPMLSKEGIELVRGA